MAKKLLYITLIILSLNLQIISSKTQEQDENIDEIKYDVSFNYEEVYSNILNFSTDVYSSIASKLSKITNSAGDTVSSMSQNYNDNTCSKVDKGDCQSKASRIYANMPDFKAIYNSSRSSLADYTANLYNALVAKGKDNIEQVISSSTELKQIFETIVTLLGKGNDLTAEEKSEGLNTILQLTANYLKTEANHVIKSNTKKFDQTKFLKINSKAFFEGLLEGVSTVPIAENQCYANLAMSDVYATVEKFYREGDFSLRKATELVEYINMLRNTYTTCGLEKLLFEIKSFASVYGYGVIAYRAIYNLREVYGLVVEIIDIEDSKKLGIYCGKLAQIIIDYHTS
jgi:hypothetical protein